MKYVFEVAAWFAAAVLVGVAIFGLFAMEKAHAASCRASWFAARRSGVAMVGVPLGTPVRICLRGCAETTVVDRGPFVPGRCLDLSRNVAARVGLLGPGVARVGLLGPGVATVTYEIGARQRVRREPAGGAWHDPGCVFIRILGQRCLNP